MNNKQWNMLQRLKMQRLDQAFVQPSSFEQELEEILYFNF